MDKNGLAKELKIARAKAGVTQEELANKADVSVCAIALLEGKCSTSTPRFDTLVKLEKALGLTNNELIKYLD